MERLSHHVLKLLVATLLVFAATPWVVASHNCQPKRACSTGVVHAAGHGGDLDLPACPARPTDDEIMHQVSAAAAEVNFDAKGRIQRTAENTRALDRLAALVRKFSADCAVNPGTKRTGIELDVGCSGPGDEMAARIRAEELQKWAKTKFKYGNDAIVKPPQCSSVPVRSQGPVSGSTGEVGR